MNLQPWHRVGQLVVCVNDEPVSDPRFPPLVLKRVYDISAVAVCPICRAAHLGLAQHVQSGLLPLFFDAERFRPVSPTSIEQLRHETERLPEMAPL